MFFDTIYIQNFRNIEALRFEPARGLNVIEGANGEGKTNLLEAIHLAVTLRSFRRHPTRDLIRIGTEQSIVSARFCVDDVVREMELALRGSRRTLKLNGDPVRRLEAYFGWMRVVTFTPDDVNVFKDSPGGRRLFFDRMIFSLYPEYGAQSQRFHKVLKERNGALRQDAIDMRVLDVYDRMLAELGSAITRRRARFFDIFRAPLQEAFREIFGRDFEVDLRYKARFSDVQVLFKALGEARTTDIRRGFTSIGPQRDDVDASLNGLSLKVYASQGQHRAFILACKIAEIRCHLQELGGWPVLLMDDVSSELDPQRNAHLFSFLDTLDTQVFLTTTDHRVLQLPHAQRLWNMQTGELR